MRSLGRCLVAVVTALVCKAALAQTPDVGSESLILLERETSQKSNGGSGQSRTNNFIAERVLSKSENSVDLEYWMPGIEGDLGPTGWMFPLRLRNSTMGDVEVLNRDALLARRDAWLDSAPQFRQLCGGAIFSWAAFEIHCEVEDAVDIVAQFDLWVGTLAAGQLWDEPNTIGSSHLEMIANGADGQNFEVTLDLDPETLRSERAELNVAVAMMTGRPVPSFEDAFAELDGVTYSGTLVLGFETDSAGAVTKRTWLQKWTSVDANGESESYAVMTTIQRAS